MYGMLRMQVAVNNIGRRRRRSWPRDSNKWGCGREPRHPLRADEGHAARHHLDLGSCRLDFSAPAKFSDVSRRRCSAPADRGLLNANLEDGHQRAAGRERERLPRSSATAGRCSAASAGSNGRSSAWWKLASDIGELHSLTKNLSFKDTWHGAIGAQYRPDADVAHRPRICVRLRVPGQRERLAACRPTTSGASAWARTSRRAARTSAGESHSNTPTAARCR